MTRSLRRSRRSPAATRKVSEYNCGDIVEINRNGTLLRGRLAQLLTEGTSPNPRWLVKFDSQNHKDEEIYERSFGRMIAANEEGEDPSNSSTTGSPVSATASAPPTRTPKPCVVNNNKAARRGSGSGATKNSSSEGEAEKEKTVLNDAGSNAKKVVQFNQGGLSNANATGSDNSSTPETGVGGGSGSGGSTRRSARDRVSAREERSRRRQAKIDEETVLPGGEAAVGGVVMGGTGATVGSKRRGAPLPPSQQSNKNSKRQRGGTDPDGQGEVVKVKLLTGTLYLYRGRHRRAEFIRRV